MKEIVGTTTEQNLKDAFISESTSILKYLIFADKSKYKYIEEMFKYVAKNEQEHAEVFLEFLGGFGEDLDNLKNSIALEGFTSTIDYPDAARVAEEEGFPEIAQKFRDIATIEAHHKRIFEVLYNQVKNNTLLKSTKPAKWICMKCGYIMEGLEPPAECPVCGHEREDFKLYKEE